MNNEANKPLTAAATIAASKAAGTTPQAWGRSDGGYARYRENVDKVEARSMTLRPTNKAYGASQTECCAYCGKLAISGTHFGIFTDGGDWTTKEDMKEWDLGFYPLGSDCARRLKKLVPVYGGHATGYARIK